MELGCTTRGAGFCRNPLCYEHGKPVALEPLVGTFRCAGCGAAGGVEPERSWRDGDPGPVNEVRVEFGYDADVDAYSAAIVVEESAILAWNASYTVQTPLGWTREEAERLGRELLGRLNRIPPSVRGLSVRATRSELLSQGWCPLA